MSALPAAVLFLPQAVLQSPVQQPLRIPLVPLQPDAQCQTGCGCRQGHASGEQQHRMVSKLDAVPWACDDDHRHQPLQPHIRPQGTHHAEARAADPGDGHPIQGSGKPGVGHTGGAVAQSVHKPPGHGVNAHGQGKHQSLGNQHHIGPVDAVIPAEASGQVANHPEGGNGGHRQPQGLQTPVQPQESIMEQIQPPARLPSLQPQAKTQPQTPQTAQTDGSHMDHRPGQNAGSVGHAAAHQIPGQGRNRVRQKQTAHSP